MPMTIKSSKSKPEVEFPYGVRLSSKCELLSLDLSKAFDSVRHSQLLHKFAQLDLPDHIFNWLANFFNDHSHCTVFHDQQSFLLDITASIIQGSAIGPAAFVVTAGDLTPLSLEILYVNLLTVPI